MSGEFSVSLVQPIPKEANYVEFQNVTVEGTDVVLYLLCRDVRSTSLNQSRLAVVARVCNGVGGSSVPLCELVREEMLPRSTLSLRLFSPLHRGIKLSDLKISFMLKFYH